MGLEIDYMEYANDAAAQAAYVTNGGGTSAPTGGTITTDGLYTVHTFKIGQTGTAFTPAKAGDVTYLVVAGGASGGRRSGGGGGAGGLLTGTLAVTAQAYTITVGAGGDSRTSDTYGDDGHNSVFSSITATGGGGGANWDNKNGRTGGSGGGAVEAGTVGQKTASPAQGNNGGTGNSSTGSGGGGGAGAVGGNGSGTTGGAGGAGTSSSITGSAVVYAAGGGGYGSVTEGAGGSSGVGGAGGSGPNDPGGAGAANTGSGGGGSENSGASGAGASGIVIIRYLTSDFSNSALLQSYSEATIKTQGSYSLKAQATTGASGKTLTRTI